MGLLPNVTAQALTIEAGYQICIFQSLWLTLCMFPYLFAGLDRVLLIGRAIQPPNHFGEAAVHSVGRAPDLESGALGLIPSLTTGLLDPRQTLVRFLVSPRSTEPSWTSGKGVLFPREPQIRNFRVDGERGEGVG